MLDGLDVSAHAFFPGEDKVLSILEDGTLLTWDTETLKETHRTASEAEFITAAAVSPDGKHAIAATGIPRGTRRSNHLTSDFSLALWNIDTGKMIQEFTGHSANVTQLQFSPNGRYAVSSSVDMAVRLWKIPEPSVGQ